MQSINRFGCAEPTTWLWLILFYGISHVLYLMPVIRQMLGPWTEVVASTYYLFGDLFIAVLLYTWFNRIPEAGAFFRAYWRYGRWVTLVAYLWSAIWLVWLNQSALLRTNHRNFWAVAVLLAIDLLAMIYLLKSKAVKATFAEFPKPLTVKAAEESEAPNPAELRAKVIAAALIEAPITDPDTPECLIEAHWRAHLAAQPSDALAWLELAILAYQCHKPDQAEVLMHQSHRLDETNPVVLRNLCELHRQQGRVAKALRYGLQATELAPKDELAHFNLAVALTDNKDLSNAITHYHRVIDINPHNTQAWLGLAVLLVQQQRVPDAFAALDAVLLINPDNAQALALKNQLG